MTAILTIARFTLLESLRNRLLLLCLLLAVASFALVEFTGALAITESRQTQLALLAPFLRLSAVMIVALFVVSGALRELHDKTLAMILSMPLHRSSYYLGKLTGYMALNLVVCLIFGALLVLYADGGQLLVWLLSLFLELGLVVALCLVMLFSFSQVPAALAGVILFYAAMRMLGAISLMAESPLFASQTLAQQFIGSFIELLRWLLPDLALFTRTDWLLYNTADWSALLPLLGQWIIYLGLLSGVALFDFYRRNF